MLLLELQEYLLAEFCSPTEYTVECTCRTENLLYLKAWVLLDQIIRNHLRPLKALESKSMCCYYNETSASMPPRMQKRF